MSAWGNGLNRACCFVLSSTPLPLVHMATLPLLLGEWISLPLVVNSFSEQLSYCCVPPCFYFLSYVLLFAVLCLDGAYLICKLMPRGAFCKSRVGLPLRLAASYRGWTQARVPLTWRHQETGWSHSYRRWQIAGCDSASDPSRSTSPTGAAASRTTASSHCCYSALLQEIQTGWNICVKIWLTRQWNLGFLEVQQRKRISPIANNVHPINPSIPDKICFIGKSCSLTYRKRMKWIPHHLSISLTFSDGIRMTVRSGVSGRKVVLWNRIHHFHNFF